MTYSQAKQIATHARVKTLCTDIMRVTLPIIQFDESDREHMTELRHDSLVISMHMGNFLIKRILVDNKSVFNVMRIL